MNILFTNYCNQKCPYCFAESKLESAQSVKKSHMSMDNLKTILDFCKKSGINRFGILGGEPTLHPHFSEAIKMIVDEKISFNIFSNGIIRKKGNLAVFKRSKR